jgi:hypothetical protein
MSDATVSVFKHVRKPEYILQSYCIHKTHHWTTTWGSLVRLTDAEFRTGGLDAVLRDLEEFDSRDSDAGAGKEAKRARKILAECWQVSISREKDRILSLEPMNDIGKGRAVGSGHRFMIYLPATPIVFYRTIQEAFEECCVIGS